MSRSILLSNVKAQSLQAFISVFEEESKATTKANKVVMCTSKDLNYYCIRYFWLM